MRPLAYASISGPCEATINGESVAGLSTGFTSRAIEVEKDSQVPVTMSAASEIDHLKVQLEFGGFRWTVHDQETNGASWAKSVNVKDYAKYGIGVYKVIGVSTGPGVNCSGEALVRVKGNPLTTVAGAGAAGLAVIGVAGVAAAGFKATDFKRSGSADANQEWRSDWIPKEDIDLLGLAWRFNYETGFIACASIAVNAFLLTTLAMVGVLGAEPQGDAGAVPPVPPPSIPPWVTVPVPRLRHRPRLSVLGLAGGVLAGIGIVVLLQQYGKVYPTAGVAIAGVVGGLIVGVLVPTLVRMVAVNRANRRLATIEAWLMAQGQGQGAPPPQP